ncbi:MAG: hypothetical protein DRJ43_03550, partial [Thermoprotei archaeon]
MNVKRGVLLITIVAVVLVNSRTLADSASAQARIGELVALSLREYNYTNVLVRATRIAEFGSRAPGHEGYRRTLEYLVNEARRLNLTYLIQRFSIIAPVDLGSWIEVLEPTNIRLKAYCLWPNGGLGVYDGVLEGTAVYAGKGELDDFNGLDVNGSIVALDYDSGWNWVNALRFGAKAVIYLAESRASLDRFETYSKFDPLVPLPYPRLLLEPKESKLLRDLLRRGKVKLRVYCGMRLKDDVEAYNLLVEIPGVRDDEVVMFLAHFDAWSVAPGLANSTEEALSTAALIELMELLARNRPLRTAWILFTSGHWNGLVGPREFIRNFMLKSPEFVSGKRIVWYVIGVDLSADYPAVSLVYVGHFYAVGRPTFTIKYSWIQSRAVAYERIVWRYLNESGIPSENGLTDSLRLIGLIRPYDLTEGPGWSWSGTMAWPYVLDTEPFVVAGMAGFTIRTAFSYRVLEGSPLSDLSYVESRFNDRVVPQLASLTAIAVGLLNEPEVRVVRSLVLPTRLHPLLYWGFIDLEVRVLEYNVSRGWYDPVPGAVVRVGRFSDYPFTWILARADGRGVARVHGITPQGLNAWLVEAYKPVNNSWMYMPAYGMHSTGPAWVNALVPRVYATVNVKPLRVHALLDLYYPRLMRRCAVEDPRYGSLNVWASTPVTATPYHTETGMIPLYYGTMVYAQSEIGIIASTQLLNMTFTMSFGERWPLNVVQAEKPFYSAFDYAAGVYRLASSRYSVLSAREVRKLSADLMLRYAEEHLGRVREALGRGEYGRAYRNALAAWSYAARAYADETMPLYEESVKSALIFVPFIVISAYFFERLLVRAEGLRRVAAVAAIEMLAMGLFALTHPAFWVIPSTLLAAMSIGILILMAAVLWIFYREARDIVMEFAARLLGYHEVVGERMAATIMAVSLSTENMRKRPLRTVLTLTPVTVFAMALISLASISPYTAVLPSRVEGAEAPYYGIALKRGFNVLGDVLDYPTVEIVKAIVGDKGEVCPRVWYYPALVYPIGPMGMLLSVPSSHHVTGILGLTPEEARVVLRRGLVKGSTFLYED